MTQLALRKTQSTQHKKSNIKWVDPKTWKENKNSMYRWAKEEARIKKYKTKVGILLEILVDCSSIKGITDLSVKTMIEKIEAKYPGSKFSRSSIFRYLAILSKGKSIKRGDQTMFNKPCRTKLLIPKLVNLSVSKWHTDSYSPKGDKNMGAIPPLGGPQLLERTELPTIVLFDQHVKSKLICEMKELSRNLTKKPWEIK